MCPTPSGLDQWYVFRDNDSGEWFRLTLTAALLGALLRHLHRHSRHLFLGHNDVRRYEHQPKHSLARRSGPVTVAARAYRSPDFRRCRRFHSKCLGCIKSGGWSGSASA